MRIPVHIDAPEALFREVSSGIQVFDSLDYLEWDCIIHPAAQVVQNDIMFIYTLSESESVL